MDGGHTMEKRLANFPRANIIQRWIFLPFPFHAIHLTVLIPLVYFCCCRWCRSFVAPYYNTPARPSSAGFAIPSAATRTKYSPHASPFGLGLTNETNPDWLWVKQLNVNPLFAFASYINGWSSSRERGGKEINFLKKGDAFVCVACVVSSWNPIKHSFTWG